MYSVEAGSSAIINIFLEGAVDVYAIDIRVSFDPSVVEVVDSDADQDGIQLKPGQFPQADFIASQYVDAGTGTARYIVTQVNPTPPANGSGVAFSLELVGKGIAGESDFRIEQVEMSNRSGELLPVEWEGATIQVIGHAGGEPLAVPTSAGQQPTTQSQLDSATATPPHRATGTSSPSQDETGTGQFTAAATATMPLRITSVEPSPTSTSSTQPALSLPAAQVNRGSSSPTLEPADGAPAEVGAAMAPTVTVAMPTVASAAAVESLPPSNLGEVEPETSQTEITVIGAAAATNGDRTTSGATEENVLSPSTEGSSGSNDSDTALYFLFILATVALVGAAAALFVSRRSG